MSACDNGERNTEGCHAFSVKHISMTQCKARWPTFLFHSGSLSTVALPLGATTTPVRFNRVYSKVTAGTLSVVSFCCLLPQCMNWSIRLMDCPCSHNRGIFSLHFPPPLQRCWCLHLWLRRQPLITSMSTQADYSRLLFNATNKTYCSALWIIISGLRPSGGWESGLAHI